MTKFIAILCVILLLAISAANAGQSRRLEEENKPQITETEREAYIRWVLREEIASIESLENSVKNYADLIASQEKNLGVNADPDRIQQHTTRVATMKVQLGVLQQRLQAARDDYESKHASFTNNLC